MTTGRINQVNRVYTNRAAKLRYGKHGCQTSDITHFQMATNPKHVRYRTTVCRTHFVTENTLLSDLFINRTQSLNPTLWRCRALETRTRNDTHPLLQKNCPGRKRRQCTQAWRDAQHQLKQPKNFESPTLFQHTKPQRSSTTRVQRHSHNVGY